MVKNLKASNTQNNIRQMGSPEGTANSQNQILSALDTLGAKLVRSESERETMRRLLNEAMEAQDRLETQIERSQITLQRRIDLMEDKDANLSTEDKTFIETQKKETIANRELMEDQTSRQLKIEDKLRDSLQTIQKLQRRLDSQEQKRAKLQRRVERVENIAADAQNALEAKAMVLLTDRSDAMRHLPQIDATAPMQILNDLHGDDLNNQSNAHHSKNKFGMGISVLAVLIALGLGWGMATLYNEKSNTVNNQIKDIIGVETPSIDNEIVAFEIDWLTNDVIDDALMDMESATPIITSGVAITNTTNIQIDRDLTLPDSIKDLEDKAFAGIAEAQHDLGALYTAGQAGVTQNYERAGVWFQKSAAQGIGNAAYNLGVLYQQGLGQEQDLQRALDWYRRAAQLGHPEAQYNLGIAYIEGVGTRYNPNMAAAFFQQSALGGITEAAYNLGLILENGLLGEVRNNDALKWYRAASENGNEDATLAFKTLAKSMDIPLDQAGLSDSGESLSGMIDSSNNVMASPSDANNIDLGTLVPTQDQILVAQVQEQLRKAGMYNGPQDGIVGAGTVSSIKKYQSQNNLAADGIATQQLLTYMLQKGTD